MRRALTIPKSSDGNIDIVGVLQRRASGADFRRLQEIEVSAGRAFLELDMAVIADDDPPSLDVLEEARLADRLWVRVDEHDRPAAYLMLDVVDGHSHIEQVSVHPDYAGKRIGYELLLLAERWGKAQEHRFITLTTFRDVPWNAPYYERCGYEVLEADRIGSELRNVRIHEASLGLDRWPRVCMGKAIE